MADARKAPHGLPFAPTKVGVLIDMDMGTKDDFLACLRMTFDEALADRTILRPVELVVKEAVGLPRLATTSAYPRPSSALARRRCSPPRCRARVAGTRPGRRRSSLHAHP